ncbi:MAG: tRNA ((37)-N6)-threonylcarbamoyltransferase complex ATPase subunit type 1 TsaE [Pseudomonadota bacterium]|jgi:tRNA threonylcarbamoyladenosine biosynthesis protein TsaE
MMQALLNRVDFFLTDDAATNALGRWLAPALRAGDTVLLSGPIGAGKTHLVRALLRHRLGPDTEVPSPTFTLVQPYHDGTLTIVHADLYRITHPDEVLELGLDDAMALGIALIEWPERLGLARPADALDLTLSPLGEGRHVTALGNARLISHLAGFSAHRGQDA